MIDWVTVGAQIVNFVILLVLLKVFLYDRILEAMDNRRTRIKDEFEQTKQKESDATEQAEQYRHQRQQLEDQREQFLRKAREEAEQQRQDRLTDVRQEVQDQKHQWMQSLRDQRADFLSDLRRRSAARLQEMAGKVLADLADTDLQHQAVAVFLRRVHDTQGKDREAFREMVGDHGGVEVAAAFEIGEDQSEQIRGVIRSLSDQKTSIQFVRNEDLICGVQLRAGGRAIGWNIAGYLDELVSDIDDAVDQAIRDMRDQGRPEGEESADTGDDDS